MYYCDHCGEPTIQTHLLAVADDMGIYTIINMCDDCSESIDTDEVEYEYIMTLSDEEQEEKDKYGLFS